MKKTLLKMFAILSMVIVPLTLLTGCSDDDDYWWGNPPSGFDFNDPRLEGYWELVQYNGSAVYPNETNYMQFNGDGYGYYYYLDNGQKEVEQLRYWSQKSTNGASRYQINIQYQYSSPLTTSYWFDNNENTLWLQWQTNSGRVVTYVYDRINRALW